MCSHLVPEARFFWLNSADCWAIFLAVADQKAKEAAMEDIDRLIRVREATRITGVSRDTLRRLEQRGQFPKRAATRGLAGPAVVVIFGAPLPGGVPAAHLRV